MVLPHISQTLLLRKPDEALVALVRSGSDAAFAAIVARHHAELHRHCHGLLRDQGADDAVQQTFIRALQALRSGTEVQDLRPWLHRIAHNVALKDLQTHGRDHDELNEQWADTRRADEVDNRARLREALLAIESLPDRQRTALLRSADGETPAAIAQALGVSKVAARQLVHRARVTVRAAVRVVLPPPIVWLGRRLGTAADKLPAPAAVPAALAPMAPKLAAVVAAAALGAAPATLIAAAHPADSQSPAAAWRALQTETAGQAAGATPAGGQGASQAASVPPGLRADAGASSPSTPASSPNAPGIGGGATTTDTTSTDPTATDTTATDASATDPTATDTTATDTTATDTTATDTTSTDTTVADTTATDTTATDTTATDTTATDTTSTDPSAAATPTASP